MGSSELATRRRWLRAGAVSAGLSLVALLAAALLPAAAVSAPSAHRGTPPTVAPSPPSAAEALPVGFARQVTQAGLDQPTAFAFAPDGHLFVAEKRGVVKAFEDFGDTTASVFADLRTEVHNRSDRGLLGLTVDPAWPARPYVYVLYVADAPVGGTTPTYGTSGDDSDACPTEGYLTMCPGTVRVSRLTAEASGVTSETVLLNDVCQDVPLIEGGGMAMGPEGALYVSIGTGAYAGTADYGQLGNVCGDPPSPAATNLSPPSAEGGHLRAQDLRTPNDPATVTGTVIRIDPDTGGPWPDNALISAFDPVARKVIAYGFRNPFRLTLRPGTNEVWLGDVGGDRAEEINRVDPSGPVKDYGWPCYEGGARNPNFDVLDLNICENLYADGSAVGPYYFYCHGADPPTTGAPCGNTTGDAISGLTFYAGGTYPSRYTGALFFADYSKSSIRVMLRGSDGLPDPTTVQTFASDVGTPVDLRTGPGGDLFFADVYAGTMNRIYVGDGGVNSDQSPVHPTASIDAPSSVTTWAVGDHISFSGHATDENGMPLPPSSLSWAFNLLHCYSDTDCHRHRINDLSRVASGTITAPDHEYPAKIELVLTVTDALGNTDVASVVLLPTTVTLTFQTDPGDLQISAGNTVSPAPFTQTFIVGASVFVAAPLHEQREDGMWDFHSWSDGGEAAHTFAAGSPGTFTATYTRRASK